MADWVMWAIMASIGLVAICIIVWIKTPGAPDDFDYPETYYDGRHDKE